MKLWLACVAATYVALLGLTDLVCAENLKVERLASFPSLIGTAPARPVFSPDSRRLAFLWNDEGMPFREVWVAPTDGGQAQRITTLNRTDESPENENTDTESLEFLRRAASRRMAGGVSEVVWTPDGKALIFAYQGHLFKGSAGGGSPTKLTREKSSRHSLSFSPDGKFLAFLQGGDLYLWNWENQEQVRATRVGVPPISNLPGASFHALEAGFVSYKWAPDSLHLALNFEDRRRVRKMLFPDYLSEETKVKTLRRDLPGENDLVRNIQVYSVSTGRLRKVELPDPTDRRFGSYGFSPDASLLLIDQFSEDGEHRWISTVETGTGVVKEIRHDYKARGGSTTSASSLWTSAWTSDGRNVLFLSDVEGWFHLYSMSSSGGQARRLTEGEWSIVGAGFEGAGLSVSPRTGEVFFLATKQSPYERRIYRISENGGTVSPVTRLAGTHRPFVSPDGRTVASIRSSDTAPPELYILNPETGTERRLTVSPSQEFDGIQWIEPRYVTFPSRVDGVTLHGRLLEPPNLDRSKRYPAILGPVYSNTVRNRWEGAFDSFQQYLALEEGFLVLQVDVRGSVGYGRQFRSELVERVGEIDIEDLHSGVEYLQSLPYVDAERVGIWGWSYGGLLSAMSLFKKPGVYAAGVAGAPATNVWHATTGEVDLFYPPQVRPELYLKGSAFQYAGGLRDPLMIIHGMQDTIVLFRDTVNLVEKLLLLGKDFELVVLPDSVHSARSKDYYATHVLKKVAGHMRRYLKGE